MFIKTYLMLEVIFHFFESTSSWISFSMKVSYWFSSIDLHNGEVFNNKLVVESFFQYFTFYLINRRKLIFSWKMLSLKTHRNLQKIGQSWPAIWGAWDKQFEGQQKAIVKFVKLICWHKYNYEYFKYKKSKETNNKLLFNWTIWFFMMIDLHFPGALKSSLVILFWIYNLII